MFKKSLKKIFPGVSWQNPVINLVLLAVNPFDYAFRFLNGLSYLPPYSIRVRSNGVAKQFGGKVFFYLGNQLAEYLKTYTNLNSQSKVLEIGCGCGRTAYALSNILDDDKFIGTDIEKRSLESCKNNPLLCRKKFRFDHLNVQNDEYNPNGSIPASSYKFPYADHEFDIIFLVSVFTHMLSDDVKNYIKEISRMLKPGGKCMITAFLMDKGRKTNGISFPYNEKDHYFYNKTMPEVAVGYFLNFFNLQFELHGMKLMDDVLWGGWRKISQSKSEPCFSQDIIFFLKQDKNLII